MDLLRDVIKDVLVCAVPVNALYPLTPSNCLFTLTLSFISSTFNTNNKKDYNVPKDFINIYKECLEIYEEINEYSIQI